MSVDHNVVVSALREFRSAEGTEAGDLASAIASAAAAAVIVHQAMCANPGQNAKGAGLFRDEALNLILESVELMARNIPGGMR